MERISKGDLNPRLDIKTGDEIEILADEFNEMAAHLKEAYTGLERKVAERTQALTIANEKLGEASKLKSQFLANVNHELRTPVSAIIGYAHLVLRATEGQISQLQRENLEDLLRNAERLLNQIDSLLEFSKIEAGKMEMHVEPVKVNEVIQGSHINHRTDLERWQCSNHSRNRSRHAGLEYGSRKAKTDHSQSLGQCSKVYRARRNQNFGITTKRIIEVGSVGHGNWDPKRGAE